MPKAVYCSGCRDKHNRPQRDSKLGPLTSQSDMLTTRPLQPTELDYTRRKLVSIRVHREYMLVLNLTLNDGTVITN